MKRTALPKPHLLTVKTEPKTDIHPFRPHHVACFLFGCRCQKTVVILAKDAMNEMKEQLAFRLFAHLHQRRRKARRFIRGRRWRY